VREVVDACRDRARRGRGVTLATGVAAVNADATRNDDASSLGISIDTRRLVRRRSFERQ